MCSFRIFFLIPGFRPIIFLQSRNIHLRCLREHGTFLKNIRADIIAALSVLAFQPVWQRKRDDAVIFLLIPDRGHADAEVIGPLDHVVE